MDPDDPATPADLLRVVVHPVTGKYRDSSCQKIIEWKGAWGYQRGLDWHVLVLPFSQHPGQGQAPWICPADQQLNEATWQAQQDAALGPEAPQQQQQREQQREQQRLHLLEEESDQLPMEVDGEAGVQQQAPPELDGGEAGAQRQQLEEEGEQQPMVVDWEAAAGRRQEQPARKARCCASRLGPRG